MSNYASIHVLNKERSTNEANYVKVLCAIEMKDMLNISIIIKLLLPSALSDSLRVVRHSKWKHSIWQLLSEFWPLVLVPRCASCVPWSKQWKLTHSFHVSKVEIEMLFWELKQKCSVKHSKLYVSPVECCEDLFMLSVMKNTFLCKCHIFHGDVSSVPLVRFWVSTMILNIIFLGDSVYKMSSSNSPAKINGSYVK